MAKKTSSSKSRKKRPDTHRRSLLGGLLWTLCFIALLLLLDQLALRLSPSSPLLTELQSGYRDFRSRLLGQTPPTVETVIERHTATPPRPAPAAPAPTATPPTAPQPAAPEKAPRSAAPGRRYLYVDRQGELQFADRLEDIPADLRSQAQPLAE
jgi:hypothetical protein